ncbi:MAG: GH32 C-terminal domain-containing protein [Planctomycetota bacterium]
MLSLGDDGRPVQAPVPELATLRGEHEGVKDLTGAKVLGIKGDTLIHVFLDKSIIEVFINGGRHTVARVMYPPAGDLGVEAFSVGSASVDVWRMKSIW